MNSIYDAHLPDAYADWVEDTFGWMELDFLIRLLPPACVSSGYQVTLLLVALCPLVLIAGIATALVARRLVEATRGERATSVRGAVVAGLLDSAPVALLITFFCVAGVSQTAFSVFLCVSYDYDSASFETRSFLRADLSVSCDGSEEHAQIKLLGYIFIVLWPVGMLAMYAALLLRCGPRLRGSQPDDALTRASSFLYRGYNIEWRWWEVVELLRRTVLVGFVLLIPTDQSYARIIAGLLVSILYLIALLSVQPFVSTSDHLMAAICASTLVLIFVSALLVRTYEYIAVEYGPESAQQLMVFASTDAIAAVLIALCLSVVIVLLALM